MQTTLTFFLASIVFWTFVMYVSSFLVLNVTSLVPSVSKERKSFALQYENVALSIVVNTSAITSITALRSCSSLFSFLRFYRLSSMAKRPREICTVIALLSIVYLATADLHLFRLLEEDGVLAIFLFSTRTKRLCVRTKRFLRNSFNLYLARLPWTMLRVFGGLAFATLFVTYLFPLGLALCDETDDKADLEKYGKIAHFVHPNTSAEKKKLTELLATLEAQNFRAMRRPASSPYGLITPDGVVHRDCLPVKDISERPAKPESSSVLKSVLKSEESSTNPKVERSVQIKPSAERYTFELTQSDASSKKYVAFDTEKKEFIKEPTPAQLKMKNVRFLDTYPEVTSFPKMQSCPHPRYVNEPFLAQIRKHTDKYLDELCQKREVTTCTEEEKQQFAELASNRIKLIHGNKKDYNEAATYAADLARQEIVKHEKFEDHQTAKHQQRVYSRSPHLTRPPITVPMQIAFDDDPTVNEPARIRSERATLTALAQAEQAHLDARRGQEEWEAAVNRKPQVEHDPAVTLAEQARRERHTAAEQVVWERLHKEQAEAVEQDRLQQQRDDRIRKEQDAMTTADQIHLQKGYAEEFDPLEARRRRQGICEEPLSLSVTPPANVGEQVAATVGSIATAAVVRQVCQKHVSNATLNTLSALSDFFAMSEIALLYLFSCLFAFGLPFLMYLWQDRCWLRERCHRWYKMKG